MILVLVCYLPNGLPRSLQCVTAHFIYFEEDLWSEVVF